MAMPIDRLIETRTKNSSTWNTQRFPTEMSDDKFLNLISFIWSSEDWNQFSYNCSNNWIMLNAYTYKQKTLHLWVTLKPYFVVMIVNTSIKDKLIWKLKVSCFVIRFQMKTADRWIWLWHSTQHTHKEDTKKSELILTEFFSLLFSRLSILVCLSHLTLALKKCCCCLTLYECMVACVRVCVWVCLYNTQ